MQFITYFAAACPKPSFFGLPSWYEYIQNPNDCTSVTITSINDIWLIVAAIIEILLRVAALAAIGFIIYGGFEYVTSQAEPDKTNRAKQTLINAVVGLLIAISAAVIVNFIAGSIS